MQVGDIDVKSCFILSLVLKAGEWWVSHPGLFLKHKVVVYI